MVFFGGMAKVVKVVAEFDDMEVVQAVAEFDDMEVVHLSSLEDNEKSDMDATQNAMKVFVEMRMKIRTKAVGPIILSQNGYGRKKQMEIRYKIVVN